MKIAISAGDPSGDEHAAKIVTALRKLPSDYEFYGMGGTKLREVGVHTIVDSETDASVMGFFDVLKSFPKLKRAFNRLREELERNPPDILLLVDYQDFNIRLAREAKKLGVKTFFFIAPSVWAWRPGRVKNFIRYVDHLAVIYPFEPQVFHELGYSEVSYVGHPFGDTIDEFKSSDETRERLRRQWNIPSSASVIALFPGSRKQELDRLLTKMIEGFEIARESVPNLHGVIPVPPSLNSKEVQSRIPENCPITVVEGGSLDVLRASDCGLIKSGTSNLQAALAELPFCMVYNAGWFTELMVRLFVNRRSFSIVNIIQPETVREIIQEEYQANILGMEIVKLLTDSSYQSSLREKFQTLTQELIGPATNGTQDSISDRLAKLVYDKALAAG